MKSSTPTEQATGISPWHSPDAVAFRVLSVSRFSFAHWLAKSALTGAAMSHDKGKCDPLVQNAGNNKLTSLGQRHRTGFSSYRSVRLRPTVVIEGVFPRGSRGCFVRGRGIPMALFTGSLER